VSWYAQVPEHAWGTAGPETPACQLAVGFTNPNRGTRVAALRLLAINLWRPGLAAAVADALGQGFGEALGALHESAPEGVLALRLVVQTLGQQVGRDGFAGDPRADSALRRLVHVVTWDSNQVPITT
jgi:hypothetical protein